MSAKRDEMLDQVRARLAQGDIPGGTRLLKKLLKWRPADAEGLYLYGIVKLQEGKASDAVALIRRALDSGLPPSPAVLENFGTAYLMSGSPEAAERELRRAINAGGTRGILQMRLGLALLELGRLEEAEATLRLAYQQEPRNPDIVINLGNVLAARGLPDAALEEYSRVLDLLPTHVQALYNIGTLHREACRFEPAVQAFEQVLLMAPDHLEAMDNLGTIRERMGDAIEAERLYRKALSLNPKSAIAYSNLSTALRAQGRVGEAEQACLRALELEPKFGDAMVNLAGIYGARGDLRAARQAFYQAWQMVPSDYEVRCWCGTIGLSLGEFSESWPHYQSRIARLELLQTLGSLDERLPDDLRDRTILLVGEQGIGDELFFLRYAPVLKNQGARLLCVCNPKIKVFLQRTGLFDVLLVHGEALPQRDITLAVGDLPMVLEKVLQTDAPLGMALQLQPLQPRVDAMRMMLQNFGPPPYLAVTWRGGTKRIDQKGWRDQVLTKEVPLEVLADGVRDFAGTIISLQRNPEAGETERLAELAGKPVHDASAINADLEDMLALLSHLQEYVGVSNANMHLLAGLDGRARVLIPNPAEWRWMAQGRTSPWFPRFTVYRQSTDLSWVEAVAQLRADLAAGAVDDAATPGGSLS
jgi:tetratricopeptide (TPR) repeat protein